MGESEGLVRAQLASLRDMRREHDEKAERHRRQASEHGVAAVAISREIAELPCDIDRTRDELIVHLGWHHKKRPPLGMRKPGLVAIHEKILKEQTSV